MVKSKNQYRKPPRTTTEMTTAARLWAWQLPPRITQKPTIQGPKTYVKTGEVQATCWGGNAFHGCICTHMMQNNAYVLVPKKRLAEGVAMRTNNHALLKDVHSIGQIPSTQPRFRPGRGELCKVKLRPTKFRFQLGGGSKYKVKISFAQPRFQPGGGELCRVKLHPT